MKTRWSLAALAVVTTIAGGGCGPAGSASNSTVTAAPLTVLADGVAASTVTVTIKDSAGAVVSGKAVALSSARGATDTIAPSSATTDASGMAIFTVKSVTTGAAVLTATDTADSVTVAQTVSVGFAPPAPATLVALAGSGQIALSWSASAGADSYTVRRSTTAGTGYTDVSSGVLTTNLVDTVANGVPYFYVVVAVGSGISSENSNEASATAIDSGTFHTLASNNSSAAVVSPANCTTANASCHAVDGNAADTAHAWSSGTVNSPYVTVDSANPNWGKHVDHFAFVYQTTVCTLANLQLFYLPNGSTTPTAIPGAFPCVVGTKTTVNVPLNLDAWGIVISNLSINTDLTVFEVEFWTTN